MSELPQDVIDHCTKHKLCKGCPLVGTCVAPLVDADRPEWKTWLDSRVDAIRALYREVEA